MVVRLLAARNSNGLSFRELLGGKAIKATRSTSTSFGPEFLPSGTLTSSSSPELVKLS